MVFKNLPIQQKLMRVILLTSGIVLLLTCIAFFAYEFFTFRQTTLRHLSTLGEIIATNSTAALAFDDEESAREILFALKAEKHIVAAALYDNTGNVFSTYPTELPAASFPEIAGQKDYNFKDSHLIGFQPIMQGNKYLGTLYLKADMKAMYERFRLYSLITIIIVIISFLMAYSLSKVFQKSISGPLLSLAETAKAISNHQDYSVRATKHGEDEVGLLTDAFNLMLIQIQEQTGEIKAFNQNLEQKIIDRTNDLRLVNKELEAFSYSISHDLRTPLRAIHGYMNIFLEDYADQFDDEAKRLTKIVMDNSLKMGQLIDDLLEFSKLGRTELKKSNIPMKDMVSGIWEELRRMEEGRSIELILYELPSAYADIVTLRQVWTNLISNALKYTKEKEKTVIEISFEEKSDSMIYFVKDNGAGFDMSFYNKLFGVFQRLHSQQEFEGTGVGLAIVQRIIAKHYGSIWADAKLDEGATFYFSLPKNNV